MGFDISFSKLFPYLAHPSPGISELPFSFACFDFARVLSANSLIRIPPRKSKLGKSVIQRQNRDLKWSSFVNFRNGNRES